MQCHKCNLEARISNSKTITENDKEYLEQTYTCMNPKCDNYKKEIGTTKKQLLKE